MYLEHFGFREFPFSLTPNLRFFCNLTAHKEAMDVLMVSLQNGEGFVKLTGEVGTGKTLICRKLLNTLDDNYVTAYISNTIPDIFSLQKAIAHELEIIIPKNIDHHHLLELLTKKLINLHLANKKVVIIVDEAHALSDEVLEGLRLLGNLETESTKLIQIILVGQIELNRKLKKLHMRQLEQRIVFAYHLATLCSREELLAYISFRLAAAGYNGNHHMLFAPQALKLLLIGSRGIPRLINILSHKAFLITYGYNKKVVTANAIKVALADTESASSISQLTAYYLIAKILLISLLLMIIIGGGSYFINRLLSTML